MMRTVRCKGGCGRDLNPDADIRDIYAKPYMVLEKAPSGLQDASNTDFWCEFCAQSELKKFKG